MYILLLDGDVPEMFSASWTGRTLPSNSIGPHSYRPAWNRWNRPASRCLEHVLHRQRQVEHSSLVESGFGKLDKLRHLPHQYALILLRRCIQLGTRHLQRTLNTHDVRDAWERLDSRLEKEMKRTIASGDKAEPKQRRCTTSQHVWAGRVCYPTRTVRPWQGRQQQKKLILRLTTSLDRRRTGGKGGNRTAGSEEPREMMPGNVGKTAGAAGENGQQGAQAPDRNGIHHRTQVAICHTLWPVTSFIRL